MNKKAKMIISILSFVIVVLLVIIIALLSNKEGSKETGTETKETNEDIKKAVGIYHSNNWNNNEATLTLNSDSTCKYPNSQHICKWEIKDNNITITLTYYNIVVDTGSNNSLGIATIYYTQEKCEEDIKKLSDEYINPRCEGVSSTHEATLLSNGILLHEHNFNKMQ